MNKSWKDPDTDLIHAIDREEGKEFRPSARGIVLHARSFDESAKRYYRRVTMCCGMRVQLDSDEFIVPHGEAALRSPLPVLRPWRTGREAPTCVACAIAKPSEPMRNDWGSKLRGA